MPINIIPISGVLGTYHRVAGCPRCGIMHIHAHAPDSGMFMANLLALASTNTCLHNRKKYISGSISLFHYSNNQHDIDGLGRWYVYVCTHTHILTGNVICNRNIYIYIYREIDRNQKTDVREIYSGP